MKKLTPEMEKYFIENALKMSRNDLAKKFNVSKMVVLNCFKKNNISIPKEVSIEFRTQKVKGRSSYSAEEDQFIIENYLEIPIKTMGRILNRSECGIKGRMRHFGLVIPPELILKRKEDSLYKKGFVPFNKGMKMEEFMTPETVQKFKSNQFKKGQLPPNTLPEGAEVKRIDKRTGNTYTLVKVPGNTKLVFKHIHIWQQVNGKLPKGMNIVFKDGNSENFSIENLECISDVELMQRNTVQRFPQDLKNVIQLKACITRQINKNNKSKKNDRHTTQ